MLKQKPRDHASEAARQLERCGSQREIAARVDVSHAAVGRWMRGEAQPTLTQREKIATVYGIAVELWDRRPADPSTGPTSTARVPPAPAAPEDPETARARLLAQAARLKLAREAPGITARARIDLERLEVQVSAGLARLDGSQLTSAELAALPAFAELEAEIMAALRPYPLATFAVTSALSGEPEQHMDRVRAKHPDLVAAVESANAALLAALTTRVA
jgi:transcriptional regulator with XRE-family HTH domain